LNTMKRYFKKVCHIQRHSYIKVRSFTFDVAQSGVRSTGFFWHSDVIVVILVKEQ